MENNHYGVESSIAGRNQFFMAYFIQYQHFVMRDFQYMMLIHLLTHNKKRGNISFELCFNRYKQFIKKILAPTFFLLLLSIIFVVIDGYKSSSVLFYTHIFVVLFTVVYIICSNNIELHISKKE